MTARSPQLTCRFIAASARNAENAANAEFLAPQCSSTLGHPLDMQRELWRQFTGCWMVAAGGRVFQTSADPWIGLI